MIGWRNVVVGDPLTTIAWGKQTLLEDISLSGTNCFTGEVEIPSNHSMYLYDGAIIDFKHQGFITGTGFMTTEGAFSIYGTNWEKSLFKGVQNNHPKLMWAYIVEYESASAYRIYRKWETEDYEYIGEVDASNNSYVDEEVDVIVPQSEPEFNAHYYVTAVVNLSEGDASNSVDYIVEKAGKITAKGSNHILTYNLGQNYPNPFNPTTRISYEIEKAGHVSLKLYDMLGREIMTLVNEQQSEGRYSIQCNFSELSSGVYFYRISTGKFNNTKKMILLR